MRMRLLRPFAGAIVVTAGLVVACDSRSDSFGFSSSGGSAVGFVGDAGGTAVMQPASACDSAREGGVCTGSPSMCEIGEHANPDCNTILRCESRVWRRTTSTAPSGDAGTDGGDAG